MDGMHRVRSARARAKRRRLGALLTTTALGTAVLLASPAQAVVLTWDAGGANEFWSNAQNWNPDDPPDSADDAVINLGGAVPLVNSVEVINSVNHSLGDLTIGDGLAGADSLTVNTTYALSGGSIDFGGGGTLTVTGTMTQTGAAVINGTGGAINFGSYTLTGGQFSNTTANITTQFTLNGGTVATATLAGGGTADGVHSSGTLGGTVTGFDRWQQTGGTRTATISANTYAQTGGTGNLSTVTANIEVLADQGTISDLSTAGTTGVQVTNAAARTIEVNTAAAGVIGGTGLTTTAVNGLTTINLGGATTGTINGINALSTGTGAIDITTTANAAGGVGGNGILAQTNGASANIDVTLGASSSITGGINGISATVLGAGSTITIDGGVAATTVITGTTGDGILTSATTGTTTISVAGTISGDPGINSTSTTGAIVINGTGDVTGTGEDAIRADSVSGNITIARNGVITGDNNGIFADTGGAGFIDITTFAGTVSATNDDAIHTLAGSGSTTISLGGNLFTTAGTGGRGIFTPTGGTGSVTVDVSAGTPSILSEDDGINITTSGVISITTAGTVTSRISDGIVAHGQNNTVTINVAGNARGNSVSGTTEDGVHADTFLGDIIIVMSNGATAQGGLEGIDAQSGGAGGSISVTTSGVVTGDTGNGILTRSIGNGGEDGINATVSGTSNIDLSGGFLATGGAATPALNENGIQASAATGTTTIVASGTGVTFGIQAGGAGAVSVTGNGIANGGAGLGQAGISAQSTASTVNVDTVAGGTSGLLNGIVALGQAGVDIDTVGTVTGTALGSVAILSTATTGNTTIDTVGAVTGGATGIQATNGAAATTIIATAGGAVTGTNGTGVIFNNTATGTSTLNILAAGNVSGGLNGVFQNGGLLNGTNNGTLSGPVAINVAAGTSNYTNAATGIGMLVSAAGVTSTLLTNSGTWSLTPGGTSLLDGTNDQITNTGQFRFSGTTTTLTELEAFNNTGTFRVLQGASATPQTMMFAALPLFNNAGGIIDLQNTGTANTGTVADVVNISGTLAGGAGGSFNADIDLSQNNTGGQQLSDQVVTGDLTGHTTVNFNRTTVGLTLQDNDIVVINVANAANTSTSNATGLPSAAGLIQYTYFKNGGGDWVVHSAPNLAAIGGVTTNVALVQATLGAIVNRPSSPFVSGIAAPVDPGECGPGIWSRGVGGAVRASGTSTSPNIPDATSTVGLSYAGMQFGMDLACFNIADTGIDVAVGTIAGANFGRSTQPVPNAMDTQSSFKQGYGGVYGTFGKGQFSADLQARLDATRFTYENADINLVGATLDTLRATLSGSASYALPLTDDSVFVPTAGFSLSRTTANTLTFTSGQTLTPDVAFSKVGFVGATVAKTFVQPDQVSAIQPFLTGTIYNDFAAFPTYVFADPQTGSNRVVTSSHLGSIKEVSLGTNFFRIFEPAEGKIKQFNATVRVDTRFSQILMGAGLTAQVRAQF